MRETHRDASSTKCKTWTSHPAPRGAPAVPADARSVRYGDGVFVTLGIRRGLLLDPVAQLARLGRAAERIGLLAPPGFDDADQAPYLLGTLLEELGVDERTDAVARLQWSAGPGRRGFGRGDVEATVTLDVSPAAAIRRPALVVLDEADAPLPALPDCKTCSALAQIVCERAARRLGADSGIRTVHGLLLETGSANLFWLAGSRLFTPAEWLPLYAGSVRERVIETAREAGLAVEEGEYPASDLRDAEAILVTNAARGVEFASHFDARTLPEVPALARALAEAVAARREAEALPLGWRDAAPDAADAPA